VGGLVVGLVAGPCADRRPPPTLHPRSHPTPTPHPPQRARLVAQTALQPGLASVCREALRQGPTSAAFRYAPVTPSLAALTFCEAWRLCRAADAWLVGAVCGGDGRLLLNPSPHMRLQEGDELVALARGGESVLIAVTGRCALVNS